MRLVTMTKPKKSMKMMTKINLGNYVVVGIDYSMSSPAICVHKSHWGDPWSFSNCRFHFVTDRKKCLVRDDYFCAYSHEDYLTQEQRFDNLASWALHKIPDDAKIYIEGYAFGAKGVIFNIGENGGVLKNKIWNKYPTTKINILSPSTVKKFATGKGNSDKVAMHRAFVLETGIKLENHFGVNPGDSPISDIIDAYYIAKLGFEQSQIVQKDDSIPVKTPSKRKK